MLGSTTNVTFDRWDFLSLQTNLDINPIYRYNGSLTTHPCTEGNLVCPLNIEYGEYTTVRNVLKFKSRFTQNNPGEKNLIQVAA